MQMTIGRRLAEAVGSWLHMEFCCYRAGLLSEGALKAVVGQVLSSFPISTKGARVYADFAHSGLNPVKRTGRKKEVDFALVLAGNNLPKNNAEVLIEAKWTNSTHCTSQKIFADFLRLAILKRVDQNAKCIFLLAGHTSSFDVITGGMPFISSPTRNTGVGKSGWQKRVTPNKFNLQHKSHWGGTIIELLTDGLTIPDSFVAQACNAHPIRSSLGTVDFQAQCWEIVEVSDTNLKLSDWL